MTSRPRILFLLPFPPDPAGHHGGSRMTGQLLASLSDHADLGVLCLKGAADPPLPRSLRSRLAFAEEIARPEPFSSPARLARATRRLSGIMRGRPVWVTDWAVPTFDQRVTAIVADWEPDIVQAEFHVMAQYIREIRGRVTIVGDHEPGAAASADLANIERGVRRLLRRLDTRAWRRYERDALGHADALVVFTDQDKSSIARSVRASRIERITPGVQLEVERYAMSQAEEPIILFMGNFVHPPNVESAMRLAGRIFPLVSAHRGDAELQIVGDTPPRELRALATNRILVTGRVDDAMAYLAPAAVVAVPITVGGGIRMKVMEALAAGKAIVATPRALAGLEITPGEHALVADDDKAFAQAILSLLESRVRRQRMENAARAWALTNLRWEQSALLYMSLYRKLLSDPGTEQHSPQPA